MRSLLRIADVDAQDLDGLVQDASSFVDADPRPVPGRVGLVFLSSSLRTRIGFAVAASRLGMEHFDVVEQRWTATMSSPESLSDTLRTVAGMVDVVIVRCDEDLTKVPGVDTLHAAVVNGGDQLEHPTQALIDLFAIETLVGPVAELRITMMGDATMRASKSLLRLFRSRPPKVLHVAAPPSRMDQDLGLSGGLAVPIDELDEVLGKTDVLLLPGLPPGRPPIQIQAPVRREYALTEDRMKRLSSHATVISPMPLIDEIDDVVRLDPRIRIFDHSDLGVPMRMAVLRGIAPSQG